MTRRGIVSVLTVVGVVALLSNTVTAQCAMCRRALQSPEGLQMVAAFRSGILFLLAAPFAIFGTVATLAVRRFRKTSVEANATNTVTVHGQQEQRNE